MSKSLWEKDKKEITTIILLINHTIKVIISTTEKEKLEKITKITKWNIPLYQ